MRGIAVVCAVALAGCGRFGFASEPDAAPTQPDAAIDPACDPRTPMHTVALYTFDGAELVADATGAHDGAAYGDAATLGSARCGSALALPAAGDYALVPDSPAFDLAQGAVSFYARVDAFGVRRGLLSRDANGTPVPGHFTLAVSSTGVLWVRMQLEGDLHFYRCGDAPVTPGAWFHVGVSFGPPGFALWIDHQPQTARDVFDPIEDGSSVSCLTEHTAGIAGPGDAWAIGGLLWTATEGELDPTPTDFLAGGAIDHLRISDAWTDFSAP